MNKNKNPKNLKHKKSTSNPHEHKINHEKDPKNETPTPPKHQNWTFLSFSYTFWETKHKNTKLKPRFSSPKHNQTQNSRPKLSCAFWETKHIPHIQILELTTNPPLTSNSKLSNPKEINLISDNKTTSSLSHHYRCRCFLLTCVCLGCGFKRIM